MIRNGIKEQIRPLYIRKLECKTHFIRGSHIKVSSTCFHSASDELLKFCFKCFHCSDNKNEGRWSQTFVQLFTSQGELALKIPV